VHIEQSLDGPIANVVTAAADAPAARRRARAAMEAGAKRTLDIVVAGGLLVVLSPILLAFALLIRIDSPGPAFFRCRRVGLGGRDFPMLKFRKMVDGAGGPPLRAGDDERYTRLGRFLAGSRLDEFPQLWNVVRGDMSLVGPRPEDPIFVAARPEAFAPVLRVRPGITGLSQLAFAKEDEVLDPDDRMGDYLRRILPQKLAMDRLYVDTRSLRMDLRILDWTAVVTFLGRDVAVNRKTGALNVRRRPAVAAGEIPAHSNGSANGNGYANGNGNGNGNSNGNGNGYVDDRLLVAQALALNGNGNGMPHALNGNGNGNGTLNGNNGNAGNNGKLRGPARVNAKGFMPSLDIRPQTKHRGDLEHVQVVILAGGRGTRLAPYTSILPKPLMPVGDRSILETIIDQLSEQGVRSVNLCVGYLSHLIRTVFDHRPPDGVDISYVQEQDPLGTAAPLRLIEGLEDTFIVMNGDVLTTLDFEDLLRHHRENDNVVTIATHDRRIKIDYGMLHLDSDDRVREYEEKPEIVSPVSMGIYVMEPEALDYLPSEGYFDFPNLVEVLLEADERVGAYRYGGLWFDIGRHSDYEKAVAAWTAEVAEAA
jgi:lipopolysaccharide/colanic/teichoic acid biosynthesis glycosyltransferase/dTDP-glucose pyrophosphorylase